MPSPSRARIFNVMGILSKVANLQLDVDFLQRVIQSRAAQHLSSGAASVKSHTVQIQMTALLKRHELEVLKMMRVN